MEALLTLIILLFPFLYKYSFVISNQYSQIPIILSYLDKTYLLNDWYVNLSREFGPRTIFAWYMAQIAKITGLPLASFLHYLIYISLLSLATYKLSFLLIRNKYIALLTTISILFGGSITLGGNILVTQDFSAPQLPLGITLFAFYLMFTGRLVFSSLLFSLASYLHPLIGIESFAIFFMGILFVKLGKKKVKQLITHVLIPYALTVAPLIFQYFLSYGSSGISGTTKTAILSFMRNPHHYLASTFPLAQYLYFFFFLALLFAIILKTRRKKIFDPGFVKLTKISILIISSSSLIGFVATEIFSYYPLTVLQPFRMTLYIYWLAAIIIFSYAFKRKFALVIPLFLTKLLLIPSLGKIGIIVLFLGAVLVFLYGKVQKWVFLSLLIVYFSLFQFHQKFNYDKYYVFVTSETELAEWTKVNTPSSSIFLVPPEFENFRLVSERAIVADWKAFPFQEKAMLEWAQRICDLGNKKECDYKKVTREEIIEGYKNHTAESFTQLSRKYNADYLVSEKELPKLKKIYSNGKYYLYTI